MNNENETVDLEQIRVDLEAWRGQRRKGERIPAELWERVAAAVAQHGLKRVSRILGLDYDRLKRKVGGGPTSPKSARPAFVELGGTPKGVGLPCLVELEQGAVVALSNYTLQPSRKVTLAVTAARKVVRVESVHAGRLKFRRKEDNQVEFALPLRETDFVLLRYTEPERRSR
jgi:hypothetical protein